MPLDRDKVEKPLRKLRKLIAGMPKQPSPEQVHEVRTRTRRVEAILQALLLDQEPEGRRVLKTVAPVRKRAGKVRDMDVLIGHASTLSDDGERECLVQLIEHLGEKRVRGARKLHKAAAKRSSDAGRLLKHYAARVDEGLKGKSNRGEHWPQDATAVALQLSSELAAWPKLAQQNLHEFRKQAKQLRYVVELTGEKNDLISMLGEVKDTIGEWHDWVELSSIAEETLPHATDCRIIQQIRIQVDRKFDDAITIATQLRRKYFNGQPRNAKRKKKPPATGLKPPVLEASGRLAA